MITLSTERFAQYLPQIKALLVDLVQIESPSTDKTAVDRFGQRLISELHKLGAQIQVVPQNLAGDHIISRWGNGPGGLLVLCHMDTVYGLGTLARQPLRETGGKLYGPGVLDMKAGIATLLSVLRLFKQERLWPVRPLTTLFTSDEEVGSLTSRALIESEARRAGMVFCLEPALSNGAIKTSRKGTGDIEIRVKGVAAHAGVDHEKGRNAIVELAHHIIAAQNLTDYRLGTTVNVGVISGGTRSNVVPDEAHALVDFRVTRMEEVERLQKWTQSLTPYIQGTTVSTELIINRPPMPRDAIMAQAFQKAQAIAQETGLLLTEGSTGGGSDANFVAPLGIPVLDGLGVVGDEAHSEREHVMVESLPERAALLSALLLNW
jgi:glutamate carboxypeptidase